MTLDPDSAAVRVTLDPDSRRALEAVAGADALAQHAPLVVDGVGFEHSLRPPDPDALARCLAVMSERGVGAVVRGGATRLDFGNPPRGASLLLDTRALAGVESLEPGEGVVRAGAGTPLGLLCEKVAAEGWDLPLDPPGHETTLGGVVASAAFGPLALAHGTPRDSVLGLDVALATGERTRCGGRVVKNVTGYDLAKLYTGSFGALGVIEAVWLRLRPAPEEAATFEATSVSLERAVSAALAVARRETTRAVAVDFDAQAARTVVELAGDARVVESEAAACVERLGARPGDTGALAGIRERQASGEIVVRLTALASGLAASAQALRDAGAEGLVYPGLGVSFARFAAGREDAFDVCQKIARSAGGRARLERAPLRVKRASDVYGAADDALRLERALKQRFDPAGILNPGRSAGGS